ncbi:LysR family transcriptional regulator [Pseudomonas sp. ABC1]|uniref:LysR family transcriptional regulator n=1 Tax=Pseudomonas sp. ABC1 TaxID=2748080 RepID=UPI0015C2E757|nr:LysR family transcriptional regulator [Pseudomonas sp. ABC1]QLF93539.1 LysR family transcriptional regulator [Pseudomonas sp. ABC1]
MDRLKAMTTFVAIVDAGSLSAAATKLGQSPAAVVRTLAALEKHLGVRLLNRTTRRLALTDEGSEYLAWCQRILAEFEVIEQAFDARSHRPGGIVRMTAPVAFGHLHVVPLVNRFLGIDPALRIELTLLDRTVDLLEEGLDLAVRIGHLPDSSMIARPVGKTRHVTCASPGFLERTGELSSPDDLARTDCIVFSGHGRRWEFLREQSPITVEVTPRLVSNQVQAVRLACEQGIGVARLLHYQVAEALADGRLTRVLAHFELPDVPIQLVYPHSRLLSPRVRRFIDWAAPLLSQSIPEPS